MHDAIRRNPHRDIDHENCRGVRPLAQRCLKIGATGCRRDNDEYCTCPFCDQAELHVFHRDHIECSEKYPQKFDRQETIHLLVERATQQNVLQSIEASSLHTFEVSDTLFRSESTEFFLEAVLFVDPVGSTARRQGLPEGKPAMKCWVFFLTAVLCSLRRDPPLRRERSRQLDCR